MAAPMRTCLSERFRTIIAKNLTFCNAIFAKKPSLVAVRHASHRRTFNQRYNLKHFVIAGGIAVTCFEIFRHRENLFIYPESQLIVQAKERINRPHYEPVRSVRHAEDRSGLRLVLYQYQSCPFCCKVRAYLDYFGLSYDVIEVDSLRRTQIKWANSGKLPLLVVEGQGQDGYLPVTESSVIVSLLHSFFTDRSKSLETLFGYYPPLESKDGRGRKVVEYPNKYFVMMADSPVKIDDKAYKEERRWRQWTDDVLIHVISPNIYRNPREALHSLRYFSEEGRWSQTFSALERFCMVYLAALGMPVLGWYLKTKYKLKDDVRESLYDACHEWTKALENRPFMGGSQPNLADLSVYGVVSAIQGCKAFNDAMAVTAIKPWFKRMKEAVTNHQGAALI